MKKIINFVLCFFSIIILFISLLVITSSFDSRYIFENTKESSNVLLQEGNRKIKYIFYRNNKMQFDNYTDALMINTAYSINSDNAFESVMLARKNYIKGITTKVFQDDVGELKSSSKYKYHNEVGELSDLVNGEEAESFEYARYWHGYLIFLRPILLIFNLSQIRVVLTILLICIAVYLLYLIYKKINFNISLIFFMGLLWAEYFYLGLSLQGIFIFIIACISSIYILLKNEKIKNDGLLFFIIGMLTNFFDFLTVPLVTLGMPLIIFILLRKKEKMIDILKIFFKNVLLWGIGYGLTWLTKWIIVDISLNRDLIRVAISQVMYRSVGVKTSTIKVWNNNLLYMIIGIYISIIINILAIYLNGLLKKDMKLNQNLLDKNKIVIFFIIMIFPFIWYYILKNHSLYHSFFTYRNLILTNLSLNLIIERIYNKY